MNSQPGSSDAARPVVGEHEARRAYMDSFYTMATTDDVLDYKWPTQRSLGNFVTTEETAPWVPALDLPPIPASPVVPVIGVAPSVKLQLAPLRKDAYRAAVDRQRTGHRTPGETGFGLTRNREKFAVPGSPAALAALRASSLANNTRRTSVAAQAGITAKADGESEAEDPAEMEETAAKIAAIMLNASAKSHLPDTKEEDVWREIFRACCDVGSTVFFPSDSDGDSARSEPPPAPSVTSSQATRDEQRAGVGALLDAAKASPSAIAQKLAEQPALRDALRSLAADGGGGVGGGGGGGGSSANGSVGRGGGGSVMADSLTEDEWVGFCDAVRDITKWNDFL